jgi:hypothetical protein
VLEEARENPWIRKTGARINRKLDDVNSAVAKRNPSKPED